MVVGMQHGRTKVHPPVLYCSFVELHTARVWAIDRSSFYQRVPCIGTVCLSGRHGGIYQLSIMVSSTHNELCASFRFIVWAELCLGWKRRSCICLFFSILCCRLCHYRCICTRHDVGDGWWDSSDVDVPKSTPRAWWSTVGGFYYDTTTILYCPRTFVLYIIFCIYLSCICLYNLISDSAVVYRRFLCVHSLSSLLLTGFFSCTGFQRNGKEAILYLC